MLQQNKLEIEKWLFKNEELYNTIKIDFNTNIVVYLKESNEKDIHISIKLPQIVCDFLLLYDEAQSNYKNTLSFLKIFEINTPLNDLDHCLRYIDLEIIDGQQFKKYRVTSEFVTNIYRLEPINKTILYFKSKKLNKVEFQFNINKFNYLKDNINKELFDYTKLKSNFSTNQNTETCLHDNICIQLKKMDGYTLVLSYSFFNK